MKKVLIALLAIACIFSVVSCNDECEHKRMTPHAGQPATCVAAGNIAYWECDDCHATFSDMACTTPLSEAEIVIAIDASAHGQLSHHTAQSSTCLVQGNIEYYDCPLCNAKFTDSAGTTPVVGEVTLQLAGHTLSHHTAATPTCTQDGNIEYWNCSVCSGNFSNSTGTTAITGSTSVASGPAYHAINDSTHKCTTCQKTFEVDTWAKFAAAVAAKDPKIWLTADIAWDNTVATLDLTGIVLDLNTHSFTGLSASTPYAAATDKTPEVPAVPMTVITGDSFTIKNGTISGTASQQGMLLIGTEYATAVAFGTDVSAADSSKAINITDVAFSNAGLIIGIKYVNVKNVTATCKNDAIMFNGGSGTVENVTATTTSTSLAALHCVGAGSVVIKGTNTFNGNKIGIKAYRGVTVDVTGGTTSIVNTATKAGNEMALQIYESSTFTVESGVTINASCDSYNDVGIFNFANAYKGTRSARITFKSGSTINVTRSANTQSLFWGSNATGRYVAVIEDGATVTINSSALGTIAGWYSADTPTPTPEEFRLPINSKGKPSEVRSIFQLFTSGEVTDPESPNIAVYDFRAPV